MKRDQRRLIARGFGEIARLAIAGRKSTTEDPAHLRGIAARVEELAKTTKETLDVLITSEPTKGSGE